MISRMVPALAVAVALALATGIGPAARGAPGVLNTNLQMRLVLATTNSSGAHSVRLAKDPRDDRLYYLKINGDIFRVDLVSGASGSTSTRVYSAADHGIPDNAQGMAIGPDGTIYVVGNFTTNNGNFAIARVMKGVPDDSGARAWSLLVRTEPYPRSRGGFDHIFNGIAVSPDGRDVYLNSGARTDHGEVESAGGQFPGLREAPLTTKILRVPAAGSDLVLTNDTAALTAAGYIFAEGVRNAFDLAFGPGGELFGTDNGPDRSMADELNWLREGHHYGFPWRMGGADNPQQFPDYDPATDRLLDPRFTAVEAGLYANDPTFPAPPGPFTEPVINVGPDADSYQDPGDGSIRDASDDGKPISTFTPHRSPLGLVFDNAGAMGWPFHLHGFMLSWTAGDPDGAGVDGPFRDASQDLADLALTRLGDTNYQARVTRLVDGFSNPIDSEIISNKVYVIEYGGNQGLWEITFPAAVPMTLDSPAVQAGGSFQFQVNAQAGAALAVEVSTNLLDWLSLTNLVPTTSLVPFVDEAATNYPRRFYRTVQP